MNFTEFLEVFGSSFEYHIPEDKETVLYDFYMLYTLGGQDALTSRVTKMAQSGQQVYPGMGYWSQAEPDRRESQEDKINYVLAEIRKKLLPPLKDDLLEAVFFSICAETRHAFDTNSPKDTIVKVNQHLGPEAGNIWKQYAKNYLLETDDKFKGVVDRLPGYKSPQISNQDNSSYYKSFKAALQLPDKEQFVKVSKWIFYAPNIIKWNGSYGGKPWAGICQGWIDLKHAKSDVQNMVQIDHVYDLQHNTSTVFNKLRSYMKDGGHSWIMRALEFKKHIKEPHALIERCSPAMKKLALRALKVKTGRSLEDYKRDAGLLGKKSAPALPKANSSNSTPTELSEEEQAIKVIYDEIMQASGKYGSGVSAGRGMARAIAAKFYTSNGPSAIFPSLESAFLMGTHIVPGLSSSKFYEFYAKELTHRSVLSKINTSTPSANIYHVLKDSYKPDFRPNEESKIKELIASKETIALSNFFREILGVPEVIADKITSWFKVVDMKEKGLISDAKPEDPKIVPSSKVYDQLVKIIVKKTYESEFQNTSLSNVAARVLVVNNIGMEQVADVVDLLNNEISVGLAQVTSWYNNLKHNLNVLKLGKGSKQTLKSVFSVSETDTINSFIDSGEEYKLTKYISNQLCYNDDEEEIGNLYASYYLNNNQKSNDDEAKDSVYENIKVLIDTGLDIYNATARCLVAAHGSSMNSSKLSSYVKLLYKDSPTKAKEIIANIPKKVGALLDNLHAISKKTLDDNYKEVFLPAELENFNVYASDFVKHKYISDLNKLAKYIKQRLGGVPDQVSEAYASYFANQAQKAGPQPGLEQKKMLAKTMTGQVANIIARLMLPGDVGGNAYSFEDIIGKIYLNQPALKALKPKVLEHFNQEIKNANILNKAQSGMDYALNNLGDKKIVSDFVSSINNEGFKTLLPPEAMSKIKDLSEFGKITGYNSKIAHLYIKYLTIWNSFFSHTI